MANRATNSITPGRVRKFPYGTSNTQPTFVDDISDFDTCENEFNESKEYPYNLYKSYEFHHRLSNYSRRSISQSTKASIIHPGFQ